MPDFTSDLVAQERAASIAWYLCEGARFTTLEVAQRTELQLRSAYYMMHKLARVLPICLDEQGRWFRADGYQLVHRVVRSPAK